MHILDIDMDFFQSKINSFEGDSMAHWNDETVSVWSDEQFISFLENECGLSKQNKIKGKIFNFHKDTYFTVQNLIEQGYLTTPFSITHIDAHSDMAFDTNINYYRFLKTFSDENKDAFEQHKLFDGKNFEHIDSGNYLVAMALNAWVDEINYVYHPSTDYLDISENYVECITPGKTFRFNFFGEIPVPWTKIRTTHSSQFHSKDNYDYICVAISPSFTVKAIDRLVCILKEYILEE